MDVSDRSLQAKLTQEAKITSASFPSGVIFAFGGFGNALAAPGLCRGRFFARLRSGATGYASCGPPVAQSARFFQSLA